MACYLLDLLSAAEPPTKHLAFSNDRWPALTLSQVDARLQKSPNIIPQVITQPLLVHENIFLSVDAAAKEVRLSLLEEHVRSQLCATAGPHALTGSPDEYAAAVRAALSGDAATSTALPGER